MDNSQKGRAHSFVNTFMKTNGHLAGESKISLGQRPMYSKNYGNQRQTEYFKYFDHFGEPTGEADANNFSHAKEEYQGQLQQHASRAGGDYNQPQITRNKNYYHQHDESVHHKISQTEFQAKRSNETYSHRSSFSDRSDITRQTALRKQSPNVKQLKDFVSSQVNLHKAIEDGMTSVDNHNSGLCGTKATKLIKNHQKIPNTELHYFESEEDLPCSTSQSAELINEKIIHPMVKKFRLLYLHNIKEEVGIMEELEQLPSDLVKFCKKMERDLPKNS